MSDIPPVPAAGRWNLTEENPPPLDRWLLVWDSGRRITVIAKFNGNRWYLIGCSLKKSHATHWARMQQPDGTEAGRPTGIRPETTSRDSQDNKYRRRRTGTES